MPHETQEQKPGFCTRLRLEPETHTLWTVNLILHVNPTGILHWLPPSDMAKSMCWNPATWRACPHPLPLLPPSVIQIPREGADWPRLGPVFVPEPIRYCRAGIMS